jgi:hypothetical protein
MVRRLRGQLTYANVIATIALFIALATGGAYAGHLVVKSSDIVDDAIKPRHIDNGAVTGAGIRNRAVGAPDLDPGAFNSEITESDGGTYGIANNAIQSYEVSNGTLTGDDINERSLGLGATYAERTTSLQLTNSFHTVLTKTVQTATPTQLNAVATLNLAPDADLDGDYSPLCRIEVDGLYRSPDYLDDFGELDFGTMSLTFGRTVFAGEHTVAVICRKNTNANPYVYDSGMIVFGVPLA